MNIYNSPAKRKMLQQDQGLGIAVQNSVIEQKLNQDRWKTEIRQLAQELNMTPEDICEYIGVPVSHEPRFWMRIPKRREYFIGIGMCLGQPLEVINRWIMEYGNKRRLYIKDAKSDLVWMFLVNANSNSASSDVNYYKLFDELSSQVDRIYDKLWNGEYGVLMETDELVSQVPIIDYPDLELELLRFVEDNYEYLKSAYNKPRKMLNRYIDKILEVLNTSGDKTWTLNSLRGYLEDGMINYLCGDYRCIHSLESNHSSLSKRTKRIPKDKKSHIELCVALGMNAQDIDTYLELMGYTSLSDASEYECIIAHKLGKWMNEHPLQEKFIAKYLRTTASNCNMTQEDEYQAVTQMLEMSGVVNADF